MNKVNQNSAGFRGVPLFIFLACAISWTFGVLSARNPLGLEQSGVDALSYAAKFGPSFAGIIAMGVVHGRVGLGELMGRVLHWRTAPRWYLFAFGFPVLFTVVGAAIWCVQQDTAPAIHLAASITFIGWFLARFFMGGGLGEELGWRGFMLPELQRQWGALRASVLVGLCWGIWHWPAFFVDPEKTSPFPDVLIPMFLFVLLNIVYSFIFTYVYNGSRSLLLVVIMHASFNAIDATLDQVIPGQKGDLIAAILMLVSLIVIIPMLIRQERQQKELTP